MRTLEKVATLQRGFDLPIQHRQKGPVRVYGSNGVDGWHDRPAVSGPGVITGRSGTIGAVYFEAGDYWPLNTTLYVRDFHGNVPGFVARLLESLDLKRFSASTGVPSLNRNFVHPTLVLVPPVDDQNSIAAVLDMVDEAIGKTEQVIAKLKQVRAGLLHDLLTRGLDEHGQLRDPLAHPEQFQDSPIGRIPKDWEVARLAQFISRIDQGWSPDCDSDSTPVGEWGVLKTTAVVWDGYDDRENKRLPVGVEPLPVYEVKDGDVLMTRCGPGARVGVVAWVRKTQGRLMLSDKIYRLIPRASVNPALLVLSLSSHSAQRQLAAEKTGMAESQTNISHDIVRKLWVAMPTSISEQDSIVAATDAHDDDIRIENAELQKLIALKSGLMTDLLTGRVPVPADLLGETA